MSGYYLSEAAVQRIRVKTIRNLAAAFCFGFVVGMIVMKGMGA